MPSVLVECVLLLGSCCATLRSHLGRRKEQSLFKRSFPKVRGRNIKSVLCSSKRFILAFSFFYVTEPALLECKSPPCWLVCQGSEGGRPHLPWLVSGRRRSSGLVGQMRLLNQSAHGWWKEQSLVRPRGTNGQCAPEIL